jgi:FMN phosphatase YigB (HAD superfamily)
VERLELEEVFDRVVLSFEVRAMKPDAAIYRSALEQLGDVPSARAVFVDDQAAVLRRRDRDRPGRTIDPSTQRGRAHRSGPVQVVTDLRWLL